MIDLKAGGLLISGGIRSLQWIASQKEANPSMPMVLANNVDRIWLLFLPLDWIRVGLIQRIIDLGVVVVNGIPYEETGGCNGEYLSKSVGAVIEVSSVQCDGTVPIAGSDGYKLSNGRGPCVDLFAPGSRINLPGIGSDDAVYFSGGTSYALAMVAGAAALLLEKDPSMTPAEVKAALISKASPDVVLNAGDSPNRFLYVG